MPLGGAGHSSRPQQETICSHMPLNLTTTIELLHYPCPDV